MLGLKASLIFKTPLLIQITLYLPTYYSFLGMRNTLLSQ
ncbi:putative membrane protein [Pseudoalteromonas translucida]|uniref:Membrane protein n=1 Tax=Pseudoalteromonas translucida (strain TAC 125) TaxID=326442 RepID=Q3IF59_PSET1|nr:putative membrane protein [Pseudoalteromonas translucida]